MKSLFTLLAFLALTAQIGTASETTEPEMKKANCIYDFTVKDIEGKNVSLKDFKGKVLLIVNTASKCGYTKQYADLVKIYDKFNQKGFIILGFPANNFGQQEPGTDKEIKLFCTENYDVKFPMFSKVSVKDDDRAPLFKFLTTEKNPDFTGSIQWNFEKFLIGKDGKLLHRFRSKDNPSEEKITQAIEEALQSS